VRIWIDMTAPAHVLVFRPIVRRLRERGHDVTLTARDYSQTVELLSLHGMSATVLGRHGGANRREKAMALARRTRAMRKFGRGRGFELALAHGSNDLALAAAMLRIPAANTFDYEFAVQQHNVGCRLARRVMVPDRIPPERLKRFGVGPEKLVQYPGLKEEYYLHDFAPDPGVLDALGVDRDRVLVVFRPPPEVALYHRKAKPIFPQVLDRLGRDDGVHAVVLPRTGAQHDYVRSLELPSVILPGGAVDAQSLIAQADLAISAGGTMNREAIALGTPVYTVFAGRLGGVDEALIREGRLRPLSDPDAIEVRKRAAPGEFERRDPDVLVEMFLGTPREGPRRAGSSAARSNS
jgi:predicted glycosyltransferase